MKTAVALAMLCVAPAILPVRAATMAGPAQTQSERLTAAAETLFRAEQKAAAIWRESGSDEVDAVLYEDVLSLLDAAIGADPGNLHAHALSAQILLIKAYEGEGIYDICTLLDARDDAEYVTKRADAAAETDLTTARGVLRQIRRIPPSAIPDPPSSCGEDDHDHASGKTSETR